MMASRGAQIFLSDSVRLLTPTAFMAPAHPSPVNTAHATGYYTEL